MEFIPRGKNMQNQPMSSGQMPAHHQQPKPKRHLRFGAKFMRIETFTVFLGVALLLVAVALFAGLSSPSTESKHINAKEYQAVFLTNGQVYFGKVIDLNGKFLVLKNVFYIENDSTNSSSATTTQNSNYTLRKLGTAELHLPEDKMVVNRDSVTFWENLKDTSQVVTKINEYYKDPGAANTTPTNSTTQASPSTTTTTKPASQ